MYCSHAACAHLKKHGRAAQYRDGTTTCADCGSTLVAGSPAAIPSSPVGALATPSTPFPMSLLWASMVSALAVVYLAIIQMPLPFIGADHLYALVWEASDLSIGAIGIAPWISSALILECFALVFAPRWRQEPAGRAKLLQASLLFGFVFAVVQACSLPFAVMNLPEQAGLPEQHDWIPGLLAATTWVAGACLLRGVAMIAGRFGIGNGFSVLIGAMAVITLVDGGRSLAMDAQLYSTQELALTLTSIVAVVLAVWFCLCPHSSDRGVINPSAGIVPAAFSVVLMTFPATLVSYLNDGFVWDEQSWSWPLVHLALVPIFARFCFKMVNADRSAWMPTLVLNLTTMIAYLCLQRLQVPIEVLSLVVLIAIVRDLVGEWQAVRQQPTMTSVWQLHRPDWIQPMIEALQQQHIPVHCRGVHHRVLFHVFAPHIAIDMMVPQQDVQRATAILSEAHAALAVRNTQ